MMIGPIPNSAGMTHRATAGPSNAGNRTSNVRFALRSAENSSAQSTRSGRGNDACRDSARHCTCVSHGAMVITSARSSSFRSIAWRSSSGRTHGEMLRAAHPRPAPKALKVSRAGWSPDAASACSATSHIRYGRRWSPRAIPSASNTQDGLEQTHSAAKDTATLHGGDGKKVSLAESNWVHRKSPWTSRHPVARLHHTAESWG